MKDLDQESCCIDDREYELRDGPPEVMGMDYGAREGVLEVNLISVVLPVMLSIRSQPWYTVSVHRSG